MCDEPLGRGAARDALDGIPEGAAALNRLRTLLGTRLGVGIERGEGIELRFGVGMLRTDGRGIDREGDRAADGPLDEDLLPPGDGRAPPGPRRPGGAAKAS